MSSYSTPRGALDTNSSTLPRFLVVFDDNGFGSQPSPGVIGQLYTFDEIPVSAAVTLSVLTVCDGDGIALDVAVAGTGPFTYQWRHDGTPIPGASSSALVLTGLTVAQAGSYDVQVDGACGSLISSVSAVSVDSALASVGIDGPTATCPGTAVLLSAQVQGGSGVLAYQWFKDAAPLGGATAASYAIPAMQASDIGSYSVSVVNACGTIVSASHALGLDQAPAGADVSASSSTPCVGDQLTLTASATSGTQPFQYQWLKDGAPLGPPSAGALITLGPLTNQSTGAYAVVVSNACGQATSLDVPVSIHEPPANVSLVLNASQVCTGAAVTLSVPGATGSGVLTYEWLQNGQSLGAPTPDNSLLIAAAQPAHAGTYEVIVANACGAVTSAPVVLAVIPPPSTYCTAKANSLGCNAQMTWSGNPSASAGSGFDVSFGPIPGANPGLFIYSTQGPAGTPIQNAFGFLCLQPGGIFRTPASGSGGSSGTCSGAFTIDFNAYFATQTNDPGLVAGAVVDLQCWHRDPPNPGTANLSNAIQFTMCP